jgi:hypothetical protein
LFFDAPSIPMRRVLVVSTTPSADSSYRTDWLTTEGVTAIVKQRYKALSLTAPGLSRVRA